ncbi:MAG TPA: DNRLRE domain-containing protein [Lacipirellulaceae bacterium]|jgi:hypothetical protein|nr:DNRLRE domain-containing protein [Lacipirellulaceae bacterium]
MKILKLAAAAVVALSANGAFAFTTSTTSFQQDVDGYTSTFDRKISEEVIDTSGNPHPEKEYNGSTVSYEAVDGHGTDSGGLPSPDTQVLIRFDSIIGSGAGQIPANASILDAQLLLTTGTSTNSQTGGPVGAAALLQPFDSNTSYYTSYSCGCALGSEGPTWTVTAPAVASTQRPNGGVGNTAISVVGNPPVVGSLDVRSMVQQWTNGTLTNNGLAVQMGFTGTTDAWNFGSTGNPDVTQRPKLQVTYTTAPMKVTTVKNGTNTYAGETDVLVQSGPLYTDPSDDSTIQGSTVTTGQNIDSGENITDASRNRALIKFNDIFGTQTWEAPADKPVAKAWLVMTTGGGANARAPGPFEVHSMLRSWDPATVTYSNVGPTPGITEADGDIGPALFSKSGMISGSEAWFDVTSYLEAIRNGATDYGLDVTPGDNVGDGWQAFLQGSASRPRLVIYSDLSAVVGGVAGDYNGNGVVDMADYVLWRDSVGQSTLNNRGTGISGAVGQADYDFWRSRFGATSGSGSGLGSSAVPEPTAFVLALIAMATLGGTFSRQR